MKPVSALRKVLPRKELSGKFEHPIEFREFGLAHFDKLKRTIPLKIHSIGLSIWDRIVQYRLKPVNPLAISKWVNQKDPNLCERVSDEIGEDVLRDLYYVKADVQDKVLKNKLAAELLVARIFPNDLFLADVEFSNPYKMLSSTERKYQFQKYAGLGLLGTLVANMVNVGNAMGCRSILLVAASIDLVPKFARHGFEVEDTESAKMALFHKAGPPMERRL